MGGACGRPPRYSSYFLLHPLTTDAGYFSAFLASFLARDSLRSIPFICAKRTTKYRVSESSSTMSSRFGPDMSSSTCSGVLKRMCSSSSDPSVTIPMARSLLLWYWSQSRSEQNSAIIAFSSSMVVVASDMSVG